jgi:hypothetical protein
MLIINVVRRNSFQQLVVLVHGEGHIAHYFSSRGTFTIRLSSNSRLVFGPARFLVEHNIPLGISEFPPAMLWSA